MPPLVPVSMEGWQGVGVTCASRVARRADSSPMWLQFRHPAGDSAGLGVRPGPGDIFGGGGHRGAEPT